VEREAPTFCNNQFQPVEVKLTNLNAASTTYILKLNLIFVFAILLSARERAKCLIISTEPTVLYCWLLIFNGLKSVVTILARATPLFR
jgi:hypothetical protein